MFVYRGSFADGSPHNIEFSHLSVLIPLQSRKQAPVSALQVFSVAAGGGVCGSHPYPICISWALGDSENINRMFLCPGPRCFFTSQMSFSNLCSQNWSSRWWFCGCFSWETEVVKVIFVLSWSCFGGVLQSLSWSQDVQAVLQESPGGTRSLWARPVGGLVTSTFIGWAVLRSAEWMHSALDNIQSRGLERHPCLEGIGGLHLPVCEAWGAAQGGWNRAGSPDFLFWLLLRNLWDEDSNVVIQSFGFFLEIFLAFITGDPSFERWNNFEWLLIKMNSNLAVHMRVILSVTQTTWTQQSNA